MSPSEPLALDEDLPPRRPTMVDVARVAGVSVKTVSRVVNGEGRVNADMAAKVRESIDLLGFRRNETASNLRRGQTTATIGLILEDVSNPFYSQVTREVEETAHDHGFVLVTGSAAENPDREKQLALALCSRRVDGLIIIPTGSRHRYLLRDMHLGLPVVFVGRPAGDIDADAVLVDNAGGLRRAVEHLRGRGHRRIAHLADDPEIYTTRERLRGYTEATPPEERDAALVATGPHDEESVTVALRRWSSLSAPPTALVTGNNRITILALRALAGNHDTLALVGFDDFELADLLSPPVTVVDQDPKALGRTAAELLFRRIGGERGPAERIVLPTNLIVRATA